MTTKTVTQCTTQCIPCDRCFPTDVILCVPNVLTAPHTCLPDPSDEDQITAYSYIEATLINAENIGVTCGAKSKRYTFEYDDAQLLDPNTDLMGSEISGVICKNCLTTWVEDFVGNDSYVYVNGSGSTIFVSNHGCEFDLSGIVFSTLANDQFLLAENAAGSGTVGLIKLNPSDETVISSLQRILFESGPGNLIWSIEANGDFLGDVTNSGNIVQPTPLKTIISSQFGNTSIPALYATYGVPRIFLAGEPSLQNMSIFVGYGASAGATNMHFFKTRGVSPSDATVPVISGDNVAGFSFFGSNGAAYNPCGKIVAGIDGTPGIGDMPGYLEFFCTPNASATPASVLKLRENKTSEFSGTVAAISATRGFISSDTSETSVPTKVTDYTGNARLYMSALGSTTDLGAFMSYGAGLTSGPTFQFFKTRAATPVPTTIVVSGDALGRLFFQGADGVDFRYGAAIIASVDGTPGISDMPGALDFQTSADGGSTLASALKLRQNKDTEITGNLIFNGALKSIQNLRAEALDADVIAISALANTLAYFASDQTGGSEIAIIANQADAFGSYIRLFKTRATSLNANTIVASADELGGAIFYGANGATYSPAAKILVTVDGTPGAGTDMPGAIDFQCSPDGSATPASVLKLRQSKDAEFAGRILVTSAVGKIIPGATSISLRNNADSADNLIITDAGLVTLRGGVSFNAAGSILLSTAVGKIIPGVTSISLRNNADGADNLLITDAGVITTRSTLNSGGDITMTGAGKKVTYSSTGGGGASAGTFVCNGAADVTVTTSAAAVGMVVSIGLNTVGGTVGAIPKVTTITAGASFTVAGTAGDTSTYNWYISIVS